MSCTHLCNVTERLSSRYVLQSDIDTFGSAAKRQAAVTTGFIRSAWAANYTVASRVPLHPSSGAPFFDYIPSSGGGRCSRCGRSIERRKPGQRKAGCDVRDDERDGRLDAGCDARREPRYVLPICSRMPRFHSCMAGCPLPLPRSTGRRIPPQSTRLVRHSYAAVALAGWREKIEWSYPS